MEGRMLEWFVGSKGLRAADMPTNRCLGSHTTAGGKAALGKQLRKQQKRVARAKAKGKGSMHRGQQREGNNSCSSR